MREKREALGALEAQNCLLEADQQPADTKAARKQLAAALEVYEGIGPRIAGFDKMLEAGEQELIKLRDEFSDARQGWVIKQVEQHKATVLAVIEKLRAAVHSGIWLTNASDRTGQAGDYQTWLRGITIQDPDPFKFRVDLMAEPVEYNGRTHEPFQGPEVKEIFDSNREPADVARALEAEIAKFEGPKYHILPTVETDTSTPPPLQSYPEYTDEQLANFHSSY